MFHAAQARVAVLRPSWHRGQQQHRGDFKHQRELGRIDHGLAQPGKLGTLFARAGHEVAFSYARSTENLKRLAMSR